MNGLSTEKPCRDQASRLTGALAAARDVEVPEPSPLYWSHLSARVSERVAHESSGAGAWWQAFGVRGLLPAASAVALAGAVLVSGLMIRDGHVAVPVGPAPAATVATGDPAAQPDDSEAWQMLTSAAAETPIEEAHAAGMAVPAGAIDRAVQQMTPDELNALGALLQSELHRSGD
jgi:hypothetical protein